MTDLFKGPRAEALLKVLRYLVLGGLAAGVNWGSRFAWNQIMPFAAAVIVAYVTGMVTAFILFRVFVFPESQAPLARQIRNFVLVNMVGASLTWLLSIWLVEHLFPSIGFRFYPEAVGHALAIAAPTITSWFGHRYLTFAKS